MLHNLFPQRVHLDEVAHKYYHDNGDEYISFSKLYSFLSPKFEADAIAGYIAKRDDVRKDVIKAKWQKQTDEGTRIDNALTLYAQTGQILETDRDIAGIVRHVLEKYKDYNKCYEQVVVYSEKYRCAGSLDKLSILSNRKDSAFIISDFKRFEGGMSYDAKGEKWLSYPFDYLQNSKYVRISLQCSYYAYLFSELTGRKCDKLFCDMIIPIMEGGKVRGYKNQVVPLMYMKLEVETMLEHFKGKILSTVASPNDVEEMF